jgi:hypothetical protein
LTWKQCTQLLQQRLLVPQQQQPAGLARVAASHSRPLPASKATTQQMQHACRRLGLQQDTPSCSSRGPHTKHSAPLMLDRPWHRCCSPCPCHVGGPLGAAAGRAGGCRQAFCRCVRLCWACSAWGCRHTCCSATGTSPQVGAVGAGNIGLADCCAGVGSLDEDIYLSCGQLCVYPYWYARAISHHTRAHIHVHSEA